MSIEAAPEIRLAIEQGVKDALKAQAKTAGDARDKATPDQTLKDLRLDLVLEIDEMKIGHDGDKTPTCSIPHLAALALFIKRMGIQREPALKTLREVMTEALALDKDAIALLVKEQGVSEALHDVQTKVIATLPRTPVKKKVTVKGARLVIQSTGKAATPGAA